MREAFTSSAAPDSPVAVAAANVVAAVRVFVVIAAFVAGAAALPAAFAVRWHSASPVAGAPGLVPAEVCLAPLAAVRSVYLAAACISYPASACQYWERSVRIVEDHEDGPPPSVGPSCFLKEVDLRHEWLTSTVLLPVGREPRHGR